MDDAPPAWLTAVAVRVDELVGEPAVLERFRQMTRGWVAEYRARGPKQAVDRRGRIRYHPEGVVFWPRRALSLAEKFARLAAIHCVTGENTRRIDPWHGSKRNFARIKSAMPFAGLCSQARQLSDRNQTRVEGMLRDVENDLQTLMPVASGAPQTGAAPRQLNRTAQPAPGTPDHPATQARAHAAVKEGPGDQGDAPPALNATARRALEYIRDHPGRPGDTIAKHAGVTFGHFRARIVPKLKAHGVTNDGTDGYHVGPMPV